MPAVPGLRSPYAMVGRLVYFGRMLDKIRLRSAGQLPAEYHENCGDAKPLVFDARCCRFLGVSHAQIEERVRLGESDEQVLAWAHAHEAARTDEDCAVWNRFMTKVGWRDDRSEHLRKRILEFGLGGKPIETSFDLIDFDEGRDPVATRAWELRPTQAILLMGVAGCGKTTIGLMLAQALGWSFRDGDEFHPAANIAKMAAGIPLDDEDRAPWLLAIRQHLLDSFHRGESAIVTCSALKERYRAVLLADPDKVKLVYLKGDFALILQRIRQRQGHYMKENLLRSQFEDLEPPKGAFEVDVTLPPEQIVAEIRQQFGL